MARTISIGAQSYESIRKNGYFYIDKTGFVRDWWQSADVVTRICRPRRFGKTLNLDTVRCFLSIDFAGRGEELFGGLEVWDDPAMRALQGTVPVVSLSFAGVKGSTPEWSLTQMKRELRLAVQAHSYLRDSASIGADDREFLTHVSDDMDDATAAGCLGQLCRMLLAHWGVTPVVLLDEYDTPMQEAWVGGYWDRMSGFVRALFNATFKTNPALGRGLITGITRTGRESIFSDLNNLRVASPSTPAYQTSFGFTQEEVDAALEEYGRADERDGVRDWYDGFVFDGVPHIYNPWSVTQFLVNEGFYDAYWANTSGNALISSVVRRGDADLKSDFAALLRGETINKVIDEQVVFSELRTHSNAVWALLLAAGYLKALGPVPQNIVETPRELALTNKEVRLTFERMVRSWFGVSEGSYNAFVRALLAGDTDAMTDYLADVVLTCASSFDSATHPSERSEPERFYHGLVLGLMVELRGRYSVESNRESGFGRYDVALVPTDGAGGADPAIILEFKVVNPRRERGLEDALASARAQIEERQYVAGLVARGIALERIRTYGIIFQGRDVLVG